MKKSVILVGLLLMGLQMFGQYKIEGQIKNHGGRILLLVQDAIGQYDTLGNSITADGKFCFTGKVEQPCCRDSSSEYTFVFSCFFGEWEL